MCAIITDPDLLLYGTNITFSLDDNSNLKIELIKAGDLTDDGVTGQCIYSKCKKLWKDDNILINYVLPMIPITDKKFDLVSSVINGVLYSWDFKDDNTKKLIRNAGWAKKDSNNNSVEEWMGFKTLGTIAEGGNKQIYIQQSPGQAPVNITYVGAANEPIKIYSSGSSNFDSRSYFKTFIREYGNTYDASNITAIGETELTYQSYAFPLSNASDTKISVPDAAMTGSPYSSMSIHYVDPAPRSIGGTNYYFNIFISGNNGTAKEIYEFCQYKLRQPTNINSSSLVGPTGTIIGKTADSLLRFVGETLITSQGVYIDDFNISDTNNIKFFDTSDEERTFPFIAAGTIQFNDNLKNDVGGIYKMFFLSTPDGDFGSSNTIIVNDNNGNPITGSTYGLTSVNFSFDYDGNEQGGRTKGTDANVIVVGSGLGTAQYVTTIGTIAKSNANAFSLVSSLERNYLDN